ncbi:MAG: pilus assembly protein PilY [Nitrospirae bacterium]|nr:pilus assembly protein PilY [Nitrospirota bacterium]
MKTHGYFKALICCLLVISAGFVVPGLRMSEAATMTDYCVVPPFVTQSVPPMIMFETGREHKLYYEAYNDASDLNFDGKLDTEYNHSIDYYGYFDPYKCYTYSSTGTGEFNPASTNTDKFCSSGRWSGNVLNWITMSRMDVLKKVLYGGHRDTDSSNKTVLERVYIPQDAHSWGKELTGRLCFNVGAVDTEHPLYANTCVTNNDCDSGYTCLNKSNELMGIDASDPPAACTAAVTVNNASNKIQVVRYWHRTDLPVAVQWGATSADLLNSFQPADDSTDPVHPVHLMDYRLVNSLNALDAAPDNTFLDPAIDHLNNYNIFAVAEFNVVTTNGNANQRGDWQFVVDGNNGVEIEIDPQVATGGIVVASKYNSGSACYQPTATSGPNERGCTGNHAVACLSDADCTLAGAGLCDAVATRICDPAQKGLINLTAAWHRIVVRHTENTGWDGVRVWVKRRNDATWKEFSAATFGNGNLRAPDITAANECSVKTTQFIEKGIPTTGSAGAKRHLFCSTTLSDGGNPIMRQLVNNSNRIWSWASKERPVCDSSLGAPTDFTVRVEVCNTTVGLESNCKEYKDSGTGAKTHKPRGLLQKYGEGKAADRVCSKTYTKPCNTDSDCDIPTEGMCIDRNPMYFGMMSDSYEKNLSGGVLRKNPGSIMDESNINNGIFQTSENVQGNIIITFDRLKTVGFRYSDYSYQDPSGGTCGWITQRGINEGECRMWGNPIAEMMYESLRYFAGKGAPTAAFTYAGTQDSGLQLSKPDWGYSKGSTTYQPYDIYPSCSRPFLLVLSDVNPSYDNDQLPGAAGSAFSEDAATPKLNINVSDLAHTIGASEGIEGKRWFIGDNGSVNDFICSSKTISNLASIKGLCPEEPTKKGTFYSAAVAYYGKTQMKANTGKPDVNTYVVALSSPVADLKVKVGSKYVTINPAAKSLSGCLNVNTACAQNCTITNDADGAHITTCNANAYCPSNQIVDFYVDDIRYNTDKDVIFAKFRINYEDVEQGADHDMDAIVTYEICTQTAIDQGLGTCTGSLGADNLEIKLSSDYAAGCIDQVMGFVISGTTSDGVYLPVRDRDIGGRCFNGSTGALYSPSRTCNNDSTCNINLGVDYCGNDADTPDAVMRTPLSWQRTFSVDLASAASEFMKSPLWYAAKWGGFDDVNGNSKPDLQEEWDKDGNGTPDNYFLVVNPLKLEEQLEAALLAILRRASSGTAASVLASGEGSGSNLVQAIFYPKRLFGTEEIDWTGTLENLWYFVDMRLKNSTIRENTTDAGADKTLNLIDDYIVSMFFDPADQRTKAKRWSDTDGDGVGDAAQPTVFLEELKYLWEAAGILHARDLASDGRTVYTSLDGVTLTDFTLLDTSNITVRDYLQAADAVDGTSIKGYVLGVDQVGYRNRTVTYTRPDTGISTTGVWKLGDIISSTPRIVSWVPLNGYHRTYRDRTYEDFFNSAAYKDRGMVFTGANDGMLHAFRLGKLTQFEDSGAKKATLTGTDLGREEWAFIPKNTLPYLTYLRDPNYCHVYTIDATPYIFDASIAYSSGCSAASYSDCLKKTDSWRTVLIGGMKTGGACKDTAYAGTRGVKTPIAGVGYSSYFALDITDPLHPELLWEFSNPELGFSTTGPTVMKINARDLVGPATVSNDDKNGKWFIVFASGPTGPIADKEFKAQSDQRLKLFVLDLKTGTLVRTIDTGLDYAYGGSLNNVNVDLDMDYQDDVMYMGYTQAETIPPTAATKWTNGGVLRLITREDLDSSSLSSTALNPDNWQLSTVIENIGAVTSAVSHLVFYPTNSTRPEKEWLYFGTGRYYFKGDDGSSQRRLFGVKEPCMLKIADISTAGDPVCTAALDKISFGAIQDTTTYVEGTKGEPAVGWYIDLESPSNVKLSGAGEINIKSTAERVITDPLAIESGIVFFTTFLPSPDVCEYGGKTYLWILTYNRGSEGASFLATQGAKALLQTSTGAVEQVDLKTSFIVGKGEKFAKEQDTGKVEELGRRSAEMQGMPPSGQGLSIVTPPNPINKILHIRKR